MGSNKIIKQEPEVKQDDSEPLETTQCEPCPIQHPYATSSGSDTESESDSKSEDPRVMVNQSKLNNLNEEEGERIEMVKELAAVYEATPICILP